VPDCTRVQHLSWRAAAVACRELGVPLLARSLQAGMAELADRGEPIVVVSPIRPRVCIA